MVEPGTYKSGAILTRDRVPGAARIFLPESAFSADSLTVFVQPSYIKSHASSARTLKIPKTGCHTIVWTLANTPSIDRNGQRCSCGCCSLAYLDKAIPIFHKGWIKYSTARLSHSLTPWSLPVQSETSHHSLTPWSLPVQSETSHHSLTPWSLPVQSETSHHSSTPWSLPYSRRRVTIL